MTDTELLEAALIGLGRQRSELEEKMAELRQRLGGGAGQAARKSAAADSVELAPKKRTMSASARRKRIIAATKKRWAEFHAKKAAAK